MTATEFRAVRTKLKLGRRKFGELLGIEQSTVFRYEAAPGSKSARPIPEPIAKLSRLLDGTGK